MGWGRPECACGGAPVEHVFYWAVLNLDPESYHEHAGDPAYAHMHAHMLIMIDHMIMTGAGH